MPTVIKSDKNIKDYFVLLSNDSIYLDNKTSKESNSFNKYAFHVVLETYLPSYEEYAKIKELKDEGVKVVLITDSCFFENTEPSRINRIRDYLVVKGEIMSYDIIPDAIGGLELKIELNSIYYLENRKFTYKRDYIDKHWSEWTKTETNRESKFPIMKYEEF